MPLLAPAPSSSSAASRPHAGPSATAGPSADGPVGEGADPRAREAYLPGRAARALSLPVTPRTSGSVQAAASA